jgi:hypothetical protein
LPAHQAAQIRIRFTEKAQQNEGKAYRLSNVIEPIDIETNSGDVIAGIPLCWLQLISAEKIDSLPHQLTDVLTTDKLIE